VVRRVWALRGTRPATTVDRRYQWLYVYGFVRPATGQSWWALAPTVTIEAMDYSYDGLAGTTFTKGETVEFRLHNEAPEEKHELEIFGPDGDALGEVGPTKPGATGHVVVTLADAGTYRVNCGIDDHADKGMKGTFTVT